MPQVYHPVDRDFIVDREFSTVRRVKTDMCSTEGHLNVSRPNRRCPPTIYCHGQQDDAHQSRALPLRGYGCEGWYSGEDRIHCARESEYDDRNLQILELEGFVQDAKGVLGDFMWQTGAVDCCDF